MALREVSILGVDPGLTGGIATFSVTLDDHRLQNFSLLSVVKMPVVPSNRKKTKKSNRVDSASLRTFLTQLQPEVAYIELVNAMPVMGKRLGQSDIKIRGEGSTFIFGYITGMIEDALYACDIDVRYVVPSVWKRHFNLLKTTKTQAVELAQSYWPSADIKRSHSGKADAALIGCYGITKDFK